MIHISGDKKVRVWCRAGERERERERELGERERERERDKERDREREGCRANVQKKKSMFQSHQFVI